MHTSPAPLALARVPFRGGFILAASGPVEGEGNRPVPLAPFCEALGIDAKSQRQKLRGKPWACEVIITSQIPGDDQARRVFCIPLRALPMWLATIHPGKVAPSARPMLEAFQAEACDVLYRHFLGPSTDPAALEVLRARMNAQAAELQRLKARTVTRTEATELRYRLKHLEELQAFAVERNVKPARAYPPPPELTEELVQKVWQCIERAGWERFTAGQVRVKYQRRKIGRANDTVAALTALVARGLLTPTSAKHGRAYLVTSKIAPANEAAALPGRCA